MDATSTATGYIVPAVRLAVVALFAVYDLRAPQPETLTGASSKTSPDAGATKSEGGH